MNTRFNLVYFPTQLQEGHYYLSPNGLAKATPDVLPTTAVAVLVTSDETATVNDCGVQLYGSPGEMPRTAYKAVGISVDGKWKFRQVLAHTMPNGKPGAVGVAVSEALLDYIRSSGLSEGVVPVEFR